MPERDSTAWAGGSGKRTHGHCGDRKLSPTYNSWANMRQRCDSLAGRKWLSYGARGIKVCERWAVFANFLADMGERPEGKTLERIDNAGNYEPGNCRWASRKEQQRNTRRNRLVTYQGRTQPLVVWSRETGIPQNVLDHRLRRNWSAERALTQPVQGKTRKAT